MNKKVKIIFISLIVSPLILSILTVGISETHKVYEPKYQLTVMTYNIHFGQGEDDLLNLERIAQNILVADPDIVGLQEVELGRVSTQGVDMAFWLAARLNMYYYYSNPQSNPQIMGNAILSKYPIVAANGYDIPSELQERVLVHCIVQVNNAFKLDVFSVHLGIRTENKLTQVNFLINKILEVSTSPQQILMGDFNLRRDTQEIKLVYKYFVDTAEGIPSKQRVPIDYIFVRGHKSVVSYRVIKDMIPSVDSPAEFGSDHYPVVAVLKFR